MGGGREGEKKMVERKGKRRGRAMEREKRKGERRGREREEGKG